MIAQQFRGFRLFPARLQHLLQVGDEIGLVKPVLGRADNRGRHLFQVPAYDFTSMRIDLCSVHPSRGLRSDGTPFALKWNFQLHYEDRERVVLERARDSLSSTQIHRFDMLDDRCLLEANIFGRTPRKHAFYRAAAWPEQFPKPSKIEGFCHIVEE